MAVLLSRFRVTLGVGRSLQDPDFLSLLGVFRPFWPDVTNQARRACFGKRRLARGPGKSRRRGVLPGASEARADLAQDEFLTQSLPFSHTSIHSAAGDERDGERGTANLHKSTTRLLICKLIKSPRCHLFQTRRTKPFFSANNRANSASKLNRLNNQAGFSLSQGKPSMHQIPQPGTHLFAPLVIC